jgi:hypothetical protein
MKLIGWGILVILVDLRYDNVDLVVDLGGWLMLFFGLRRIWRLDNAFRVATGFAFLGAIASLPELFPPYDALTAFGGNARLAVLTVAGGAVIILSCTGLMRVAGQAGDRGVESRARRLRGVQAVSVVLSLFVGPTQLSLPDGDVGLPGFVVVALGFGTVVWFVLLAFSQSVIPSTTQRSQAIT